MAIKRQWNKLGSGERAILKRIHEQGYSAGGNFMVYIWLDDDGWTQPAETEDGHAVWVMTDEGRAVYEASSKG